MSQQATLLEKKKRATRISKQEILMMLRCYQEHPCNWSDIIADMKQNVHELPEDARNLYTCLDKKKIRDRISTKISSLLSSKSIKDEGIRNELKKVRDLETKINSSSKKVTAGEKSSEDMTANDTRDKVVAELSSDDGEEAQEETNEPEAGPSRATQEHGPEERKSKERKDDKKGKSQKRNLITLAQENQEEYNRLIKKKIPKLLKLFGVVFVRE